MEAKQQIRDFILGNFYVADPAALSDEQSLLESGIVDSTGVLEIISFLESDLGVTVKDEEMVPANLDSVAHLTAFVARKLGS